MVFGVILFVWELLPTSLVVFFFRVRRPPQERVSPHARLMLQCFPIFPQDSKVSLTPPHTPETQEHIQLA